MTLRYAMNQHDGTNGRITGTVSDGRYEIEHRPGLRREAEIVGAEPLEKGQKP